MFRAIRLRVGITLAYVLVVVPLTLGMIGYLYASNVEQILRTAEVTMQRAKYNVGQDLKHLIVPVANAVRITAEIVSADRGDIRRVQGMGYFHRQLEALPQVFSIYMGYEAKGDFYQVFHIPQTLKQLGPTKTPLNGAMKYAIRHIDDSSGRRAESYIFYKNWGDVGRVERAPVAYDPRLRPWYVSALWGTGVCLSDAYVFHSSKLVGLTLSQQVKSKSGQLIGVVGADVTLDALSEFLKNAAIGENGRVFILDEYGALVGHADPRMGVIDVGDSVRLVNAADIHDRVVADAVKAWKDLKVNDFVAPLGDAGSLYMASFSDFKVGQHSVWTIAVVAEREHFIGPLRAASIKILIAGGVVLVLSMVAIMRLSKSLTTPIAKIVEQTDRIKLFDLSGNLNVRSRIVEVHRLAEAVNTMIRSLRSFSVYVPRELVRAIVEGNGQADLRSRRQTLTVMMSDIQNYTQTSEMQNPEDVVASLNEYFECMTSVVHGHRGIVDKYIGDAIMAIWNAPISDPNHIENACRAALVCRQRGEDLAKLFVDDGREPYMTRFGLHTGEAVIGNVGSSDRMQYSAIGAMINLAARLESLNKAYGTYIMVSEHIVQHVSDVFIFRHLDRVVPVGTTHSIDVYELWDERNTPRSELLLQQNACWNESLETYFAGQWQAACAAFAIYAKSYPDDPVAEVFMKRCAHYAEVPPGPDWDGAQWLDSK